MSTLCAVLSPTSFSRPSRRSVGVGRCAAGAGAIFVVPPSSVFLCAPDSPPAGRRRSSTNSRIRCGLYLKVLTEGLADIPDIPRAVNDEAQGLYDNLGEDAFRDELAKLDPHAAERLSPGDGQRLIRGLAVVRATGRTLADWQADQPEGAAMDARFATIAVIPERDALYAATEARFDAMVAGGALDEVRVLMALGLDPSLPAMKALGVGELGRHLAGEISLEDASGAAKKGTRHFAKRQLTWLRNQVSADLVIEDFYGPDHREKAVSFVRGFLAL